MLNARDEKRLTQCPDRCSRSRSQCHRVVLESCQLSLGQCGVSTHHGRPCGSFWPAGHVPGLCRRLHHREHRLCNGSLSCDDARWSHRSGHRWRRNHQRQFDNTVGFYTTPSALQIPGHHPTGVRPGNEHRPHHRRRHGRFELEMVRLPEEGSILSCSVLILLKDILHQSSVLCGRPRDSSSILAL